MTFPYPAQPDWQLDDPRRLLLEGLERDRRRRDQGRHERVRYAPMHVHLVGLDREGRLLVSTSHEQWAGAAHPSRGAFTIEELGIVAQVVDAFPQLGHDGRRVFVDKSEPVVLAIAVRGLTRVEIAGQTGELILDDQQRGTARYAIRVWGRGIQPGMHAASIVGADVTVEVVSDLPPAPPAPLHAMSAAEQRAERVRSQKAGAVIGPDGFDGRWRAEEKAIADHAFHVRLIEERHSPYRHCLVNGFPLAPRFPDGLVLIDNL